MASRLRGRCLCGKIDFEVTPKRHADGIHLDACHCEMCRRQNSGPALAFGVESFDIVDDESLGIFRSSEWGERGFCKNCGSSLFWRMRDQSMIVAHAGLFDDLGAVKFTTEIFVDEQPDYYEFSGERERMTSEQVAAAFASVTATQNIDQEKD